MDYDTMARISRDAVLGVPAAENQTAEEKAWRERCDREAAEASEQGLMLELPFDLPLDDEPSEQS